MLIVQNIKELRQILSHWKKEHQTVGFVPTMGYLHEGHLSLVKAAKEMDRVVVSIFVNPMQFGQGEDLSTYPRDLEKDCSLCEQEGVDLIFCPTPEEMYPQDFLSFVDMSGLTQTLCGESRPGHFRGVCTIVLKLFMCIQPDAAYFGEKDAQQLAVIKQMTKDLNLEINIVGCPIIREADGLAKSSRNTYLSTEERKAALVLYQSIIRAKEEIEKGEINTKKIIEEMKVIINQEPLACIDYIQAVDQRTMNSTKDLSPHTIFALAVYIGKTRLIDNFFNH